MRVDRAGTGCELATPWLTSISTQLPDPTGTVDLLTTMRLFVPSMALPIARATTMT